ncbi:MAG TPA: glycoside hydrolase family 3 N-terminal domain-containing protein [Acidobacteriaceae bacterium]
MNHPLRRSIASVTLALVLCSTSSFAGLTRKHKVAPPPPAPPTPHASAQLADKKLNARVDALLAQMTLEEKIGQLTQYTGGSTITGPTGEKLDFDAMLAKGEIGSLFNVTGAKETNHYQHIAVEQSRLHIPLLFGLDVIHGHRTTFPVPLAMAASFDPDVVQQASRMAAVEARQDGINWVFSPMVDISRDARWGRIVESAGEDPYLGSAIARAYIRGYQQGDLSKPDSVAASVKHFAAYGAAEAGRDYNTTDMSEVRLRQVYLPPYQAAVDEGAATVMSAFNALNGVPETANPFTLTKILRKEWGFDGLVVSDYGAVGELMKHGIAADGATAAEKALTAGVDMDMESNLYHSRLPGLVESGKIPMPVVDEAVRRVLRVKFAMGLFEHPYTDENLPPYQATAEKRALAKSAAEESFVLLKNEAIPGIGRLLPLASDLKSVALIGPLADDAQNMIGSWGAQGSASNTITLRTALAEKLGNKLTYVKGTDILTKDTTGFAAAVTAAKNADLVILALGEAGDMTGEATSRAHLTLPGNQEDLMKQVVATGKPVVLVLFDGRPTAIPWAAAHVPAILEAWFPGMEAGSALVSVLTGEVSPSGKLPVEFPYSAGQEPLYLAQLPTGRPAGDTDLTHPPTNSEEKYLSRYIDSPNAPVYPFGWGLSYAQFTYSNIKIDHTGGSSKDVGEITVGVDVKNISSVPGAEVAQLYLHNTVASVSQPVRELKGFHRILLQPGQTQHIDFKLHFDDLAFYNAEVKRVVEPGTFDVFVGGSSEAEKAGSFTVLQ